MERADLTAWKRGAIGSAEFVEVAELRHFDQVLRVTEEVDNGDGANAVPGGGVHEAAEIAVRIGVGARDGRERRVFDGVLRCRYNS